MSRIREFFVTNALLIVAIFAALMTVFAGVQTVRIDGFRVDLPLLPAFGPKGLIAERDEARATVADLLKASRQARADAIAARNSEALALIELKETTDEARAEIERTNLERARAFAARGGLRAQCDGSGARPPVAAAADRRAEGGDGSGAVPELDDLQGGSLVTVTARDVEVCTVNTSRLLAAQPWGLQIEARNREPVEP
jgi:hypothetical protein